MCLTIGTTAKCLGCKSINESIEYILVQCPVSAGSGKIPLPPCMGPHPVVPGDHLIYEAYCRACWMMVPLGRVANELKAIEWRIQNITIEEARRRFDRYQPRARFSLLFDAIRGIVMGVVQGLVTRQSNDKVNTGKENVNTAAMDIGLEGMATKPTTGMMEDGWLRVDI